jgi:hypothetical protein
LQEIEPGDAATLYALIAKGLRDYDIPCWVARLDNCLLIFVFCTDAGAENIGLKKLIEGMKDPTVLLFWIFCLRHQVGLAERAIFWTSDTGENKIRACFSNDVGVVARTFRLPGAHQKAKDAAAALFDRASPHAVLLPGLRARDILDHVYSKVLKNKFKTPGKTRWESYSSVTKTCRAGMATLGCIAAYAFASKFKNTAGLSVDQFQHQVRSELVPLLKDDLPTVIDRVCVRGTQMIFTGAEDDGNAAGGLGGPGLGGAAGLGAGLGGPGVAAPPGGAAAAAGAGDAAAGVGNEEVDEDEEYQRKIRGWYKRTVSALLMTATAEDCCIADNLLDACCHVANIMKRFAGGAEKVSFKRISDVVGSLFLTLSTLAAWADLPIVGERRNWQKVVACVIHIVAILVFRLVIPFKYSVLRAKEMSADDLKAFATEVLSSQNPIDADLTRMFRTNLERIESTGVLLGPLLYISDAVRVVLKVDTEYIESLWSKLKSWERRAGFISLPTASMKMCLAAADPVTLEEMDQYREQSLDWIANTSDAVRHARVVKTEIQPQRAVDRRSRVRKVASRLAKGIPRERLYRLSSLDVAVTMGGCVASSDSYAVCAFYGKKLILLIPVDVLTEISNLDVGSEDALKVCIAAAHKVTTATSVLERLVREARKAREDQEGVFAVTSQVRMSGNFGTVNVTGCPGSFAFRIADESSFYDTIKARVRERTSAAGTARASKRTKTSVSESAHAAWVKKVHALEEDDELSGHDVEIEDDESGLDDESDADESDCDDFLGALFVEPEDSENEEDVEEDDREKENDRSRKRFRRGVAELQSRREESKAFIVDAMKKRGEAWAAWRRSRAKIPLGVVHVILDEHGVAKPCIILKEQPARLRDDVTSLVHLQWLVRTANGWENETDSLGFLKEPQIEDSGKVRTMLPNPDPRTADTSWLDWAFPSLGLGEPECVFCGIISDQCEECECCGLFQHLHCAEAFASANDTEASEKLPSGALLCGLCVDAADRDTTHRL